MTMASAGSGTGEWGDSNASNLARLSSNLASEFWRSVGPFKLKQTVMRYFNVQSLAGALSIQTILSSGVASLEAEKRDFDVFNYVDPLIGTINGGALNSFKVAFQS
jgi:hypothetical protein